MKISAISDVHVKTPGDEADKLLCSFLDHPLVRSSDYVLLLGDIFDLMCGPHPQYLERFPHIFERLAAQRTRGNVLYFEGNHDLHLESLFRHVWGKADVPVHQSAVVLELNGKSYYVSHGDEHEPDNLPYQRYKRFILSPPLRFVANHIMPYTVLHALGERASRRSRKAGARTFDAEAVRQRFRSGVELVTGGKYDYVIGGHSHVQDVYPFKDSVYVNNGYALRTRTFIFADESGPRFEALV
jgi:UDP-2,3-diacylglucosamine hydrolase